MPVPVLTIEQMRQWENATWAAGIAPETVIQQVGEQVARRARQLTRDGDTVLLLAGKGHNGDDVRAARLHLTNRNVELLNVDDPAARRRELDAALTRRPALIVDGLFGIGLDRLLSTAWMAFIGAVNAAGRPVLAVDIPSGLNAETGDTMGATIRAQVTLTVGAPKVGLLTAHATPSVGRLEAAPHIGLIPCPVSSGLQWTLPEDFCEFPPPRPAESHKGSFGHLLIFAGSGGYHGAAVLAARAAQRARPGLISLFTPETAYLPVAAQLQAVMVHIWRRNTAWPENATAMVIGPGMADRELPAEVVNEARWCWREAEFPMLCDASALDWLPRVEGVSSAERILTPHPGEAARLLRASVEEVQADRPGAVRELAREFGAGCVVLKGRHTLVGGAEGPIFVNSSGNAGLAQGGSGDALAGYLGGLLAQPALQSDICNALRYGVWQHGAAADLLETCRRNWTVEDLVEHLGNTPAC